MKTVIVRPDGKAEVRDLTSWEDFKKELEGGYLEAVPVGAGFTCYVDEDGMARGLPYNMEATLIVKRMLARLGRVMLPGDFIKGKAIFVGVRESEDPEEGLVECDLPEDVIREWFVHLLPR